MDVSIELPSVEGGRAEAATIVKWLKKEGDEVREGEPVVLVEFPKIDLEVHSPASGRLTQILSKEGKMARVGDKIGTVHVT